MKLYTKPFTKQQKNFQNKFNEGRKIFFKGKVFLPLLFACIFLSSFFSGCKKNTGTFTIWTSIRDFASYSEYYNSCHEKEKVYLVYKEDPFEALKNAKASQRPDLIISSWLKNSDTKKYFLSLDKIIKKSPSAKDDKIDCDSFYKSLYEYCLLGDSPCLLPVSFNLPLLAFANANESAANSSYVIDLETLKESSAAFNSKDANDEYVAMGYGASWNTQLLYEYTKLDGASYREHGKSFQWDKKSLEKSIGVFKEWTVGSNESSSRELNFQFKYLFTPPYKQVESGRCLYAFYTSDDFFKLKDEQVESLSYKWLGQNDKIPVEDEIVTAGIYKKAKNKKLAENFLIWFFKEDTQKALLERSRGMKLNTKTFGIAEGFSSIRSVNESILPVYYRSLLENLPAEDKLLLPDILPSTWASMKEEIIYPYLKDMVETDRDPNYPAAESMEERIQNYLKTRF